MNQFDLVVNEKLRDDMIGRIEVLEQVKEILTLGSTEFVTVELASQYYEVGLEAIKTVIKRHKDELESDGLKILSGKEIKDILVKFKMNLTNFRGYFEVEGNRFANRSNILITKRALLRIGMLLRDSEVAKEVRTKLLDIVHDAETQTDIVEEVIDEIRTEQQIMADMMEAVLNGDIGRESILKTELIGLRNKRIVQLEGEIEENRPKIEYHDEVLNSKRLMPITHIAKDLGMSAIKLNITLHNKGVIYRRGNCYVPYANYQWLVPEYCDFKMTKYGSMLQWTELGRKWIIDLLEDMK